MNASDDPQPVLIAACLRICDLRPEVDPLTGAVTSEPLGAAISAADAAALELALRIGTAWSAKVVAVTAGPATVDPVLREVAALGVDVLRIPWGTWTGTGTGTAEHEQAVELAADEHDLARAVVASLARFGRPTLVLCGDRSSDRGTGALPAYLAHELGASQALGLLSLTPSGDEVRAGTGATSTVGTWLLAERRLDAGWREQLRVPVPAVCSVEAAGVRLRRASLDAVVGVAHAPVPVATGAGDGRPARPPFAVGATRPYRARTRVLPPPSGHTPRARLLELTGVLDERVPPTVLGPLDAPDAADELIAFLLRHGHLEAPPRSTP